MASRVTIGGETWARVARVRATTAQKLATEKGPLVRARVRVRVRDGVEVGDRGRVKVMVRVRMNPNPTFNSNPHLMNTYGVPRHRWKSRPMVRG